MTGGWLDWAVFFSLGYLLVRHVVLPLEAARNAARNDHKAYWDAMLEAVDDQDRPRLATGDADRRARKRRHY